MADIWLALIRANFKDTNSVKKTDVAPWLEDRRKRRRRGKAEQRAFVLSSLNSLADRAERWSEETPNG